MRSIRWSQPSPAPGFDHGSLLRVRQDTANVCLPQSLLTVVPQCATTCIQTFATANYPGSSCGNTSDLNFLCTNQTESGLTIGEGSLQCVVSFCTGQDQQNLNVYNICDSVPSAIPHTAQTITVTILGTSTSSAATMENLPQTLTNSASTEQVSMIVMASGSPSMVNVAATTTTAQQTSSGRSSAQGTDSGVPQATSNAAASPGPQAEISGLSTTAIAGIAVGGAAAILITVALLIFFLCIRKKKKEQQRKRRSLEVEPTPPPTYQSPQEKRSPTFSSINGQFAVADPSTRFYRAQEQPVEEKRRSFWRRSILPQDIGVALSPKEPSQAFPGESSPRSLSSQKSFSRLLPSAPARALWPDPLDLTLTRERQQVSRSDLGVIDEEIGAGPAQTKSILVDNQPFVLEPVPIVKRQPIGPPPLKLPANPEGPSKNAKNASAQTARIPLTPTYDNGNIPLTSPPRTYTSPSQRSGIDSLNQGGERSQFPAAEFELPTTSAYASRNVLRKKTPPRLPLKVISSSASGQPKTQEPALVGAYAKPLPLRKDSQISTSTTIEEDTTPEEVNKELGLPTTPPRPPPAAESALRARKQDSPIKDLRYPAIPRSAAVSRQAENPAQLKSAISFNPPLPPPKPKPTRQQLVRAEASFMQTDTTSSDGYLSDDTIEWPQPPSEVGSRKGPSLATEVLKSNMAKLRDSAASRQSQMMFNPSLDAMLSAEQKYPGTSQQTSSANARAIPNKSRSGDLYFTVEI